MTPFPSLVRFIAGLSFVGVTFLTPPLRAQTDAPPVNAEQLRAALKTLKEQQTQLVEAQRQRLMQEARAASASGPAAAAAWLDAVRRMQFEGASKEGAQFRDWKERSGDALGEKEAQNAARLYFTWLHLTLQRASGTPAKELLPQVIAYAQDLAADRAAMETFTERAQHTKELVATGRQPKGKKNNDDAVKKMHDDILKRPLGNGPPAQAARLGELIEAPKWEQTPGNYDGIFEKIIVPEWRAAKDPRLLEFWDMKIKNDGDAAAKSKLASDASRFTQVRRPQLLWSKAEDELLLGQRNRAIGDMFNLVKSFPTHPDAGKWVQSLEKLLSPAPAESSAISDASPSASGIGTER